jgi:hypothetical protein
MKPTKIDLNQYEKVSSIEELEGYQAVILTPYRVKEVVNGREVEIVPPSIYLRKGKKKPELLKDPTDVTWNKDIRIDPHVSEDEYIRLINWWFSEALKDEEYKKFINGTFFKNGFDPKITWERAETYLKTCNESERKEHIHKFILNKMRTNYQRVTGAINRSKRK